MRPIRRIIRPDYVGARARGDAPSKGENATVFRVSRSPRCKKTDERADFAGELAKRFDEFIDNRISNRSAVA